MSKNQQFQKFITYKSNAAKKEQFKQEKRSAKKERAAAIDKRFEEKRQGKSRESGVGSRESKTVRQESLQGNQLQRSKPASNQKSIITGDTAQHTPVTALKTGKKLPRPPKPGSLEEKKLLAAGQPINGSVLTPIPARPVKGNEAVKPANTNVRTVSATPPADVKSTTKDSDLMPLNKFVARSGICSRRDAAEMIRKGDIKVNDAVVTEPGTKVSPRDSITIKGKKITPSKNLVYILLNKPKDYITTLDDPEGRKTVLDLIKRATDERVYPVGRLDRNTSGVLLITNDGDLAQTLSHPKNLIKKIYEVRLDKSLTKADFEKLQLGIDLEDGFIMPDAVGYTDPKDKTIIGIEIHSGRNRIVRRIFEKLGYDVRNLDRVTYAGLTKKNVQRGKWRFLTEKEVRILRHFNPQTKTDKVKKALPAPASYIVKK